VETRAALRAAARKLFPDTWIVACDAEAELAAAQRLRVEFPWIGCHLVFARHPSASVLAPPDGGIPAVLWAVRAAVLDDAAERTIVHGVPLAVPRRDEVVRGTRLVEKALAAFLAGTPGFRCVVVRSSCATVFWHMGSVVAPADMVAYGCPQALAEATTEAVRAARPHFIEDAARRTAFVEALSATPRSGVIENYF
jgi:hypothetical protein